MSEEIQKQDTPEVEQEREFTPVEQEAMAQGWRPKEEFEGDPDRFIDAGEFVRRGELFSKIDHQNKELKQLRLAMDQFKAHHANVEAKAYERAVRDLKRQRKEALAEGDVEQYDQLDQAIDTLKEQREEYVQREQAVAQAQAQQVNPEFSAWVNRNQWYTNDPIMAGAADRYGMVLAKEGLAPTEVLKKVEAKMKQEFPHKFKNPNRDKPGAVEAPASRGERQKSKYQPSEMEKRVGANLVRSGAFAKIEDYYAELDKMDKGN